MHDLYFDDFSVGQRFVSARRTVTADEIAAFAQAYDPNPFHLDDAPARAAGYPGIIASGFHMLSLSFRLFFDLKLWETAIMPSPGMDEVRWLKPLLPDQTIWIEAEVIEVVPSRSKPDRGILRFRHDTFAEPGEKLMTVDCMHRLRRRAPA